MSSLLRLRSAVHRRPNLHRLFSLSAAQNRQSETLKPIDPRKLPTDYDPSTLDASSNREPPTPRVLRLVGEVSSLTLAELAELSQILVRKIGIKEPPVVAIMGAGAGEGRRGGEEGGGEEGGEDGVRVEAGGVRSGEQDQGD